MTPFVECSRCKESVYIGEEEETFAVDSSGGFLCELCIELEKDLISSIAKVLVKHTVARMMRKYETKRILRDDSQQPGPSWLHARSRDLDRETREGRCDRHQDQEESGS